MIVDNIVVDILFYLVPFILNGLYERVSRETLCKIHLGLC